jgi:NAD(P)-dependent dehydrogenase (short-subunit alcohol dehydrogenase family)
MSDPARCLVFGGSGALGGAVCEALAARGARVAFTWKTNEQASLALTEKIAGARAIRVELAHEADVERAVDEAHQALGEIDVFVHAAAHADAITPGAPLTLANLDVPKWDQMFAVNVRSAFVALRRLAPIFERGGGGRVVLVGAVDAVKPTASPVHHVASKAALRGLAMAAAKELGPQNIRVNVVAPGLLEGGVARAVPERLQGEYVKHSAMKRRGRASEIAAVIAFFALDDTYVTGQTVSIDGGL